MFLVVQMKLDLTNQKHYHATKKPKLQWLLHVQIQMRR